MSLLRASVSIGLLEWKEHDSLSPIFFANPKSTSFRCPSESISMFSGFKSLYAVPSTSCKNSNIRAISAA